LIKAVPIEVDMIVCAATSGCRGEAMFGRSTAAVEHHRTFSAYANTAIYQEMDAPKKNFGL